MRKLIAAMKISADGKFEGADGMADWAEAWSDDYGLMPQIDACVLGSAMYAGYERYWTAMRNDPKTPLWITGAAPTADEIKWSRFAATTPHYVLSRTLTSAAWPNTKVLRTSDEIAALKQQTGKDIYLMGGGRTAARLIDAGLVDELRLIVYPLLAGAGQSLFTTAQRRGLALKTVEQLAGGKLNLAYAIG